MEKRAIILVHGFAGDTREVKPLADALRLSGESVHMIQLVGHGQGRAELSRYSHRDWLNYAFRDVEAIAKEYDELVYIGFSMGGFICTELARRLPAAKIVFVNTPVFFWNIPQVIKNTTVGLLQRDKSVMKRYTDAFSSPPMRTVHGFLALRSYAVPHLGDIHCPALVLQTLNDDTTQPKSAEHIRYSLEGSSVVKYYGSGGHLIFHSDRAGEAIADILGFVVPAPQRS